MSRQRSKTRDYHLLIFKFNWQCQGKDLRLGIFTRWIFRGDWQCQGKDTRQGIIAHWAFRWNWQCQGKDPRQEIITHWAFRCNWQCQSRDLRLGIFTHWIFRGDWQCQCKNPRQGIIAHWSSDSIDNVKAKIQDRGLSPFHLQIQLTMSRQRSKTRDYRLLIFRFDWQCQGKDSRQGIIACWSSDSIDNVKAKIQNKGLSPVHLQVQLTKSKHRSKKRDYYPRAWIFTCHWQ